VQQFKHHFREVQERAPDMSNVHEVFETLRGLQFVAAYGDVLKKHRDLLGRNAIDNIERGLKLSVTDIGRAYVEQASLTRRFLDFFQEVDLLICPAAAVSPFQRTALRRGDQRREDGNVYAVARDRLRDDHGIVMRSRGAVRPRPYGHAVRDQIIGPQVPTLACWK
jgi:Asp-tRNA(Asn)/Glu-tRNA(Gln) amidotransferase A subunit family amidase